MSLFRRRRPWEEEGPWRDKAKKPGVVDRVRIHFARIPAASRQQISEYAIAIGLLLTIIGSVVFIAGEKREYAAFVVAAVGLLSWVLGFRYSSDKR